MTSNIVKREYRKFVKHWRLYVTMVLLFSFVPAGADFLYKSYYPFDVSDANVQPFEVIEDVIEPGGVLTYKVDIVKHYPFPGTVNRFLYSEECNIFEPIQPQVESNRAVGELKSHTTVEIPAKTTPCPYILVIEVVYHPNQWRALPAIKYTTDEFLVTNKKEEIEAIKDQADSIDEFIKDKVIEEEPSEEQNAQPGADF